MPVVQTYLYMQVKTVVTTLISRISSVDAAIAQALGPLRKRVGSKPSDRKPAAENQPTTTVPNWRQIYNKYKVSAH